MGLRTFWQSNQVSLYEAKDLARQVVVRIETDPVETTGLCELLLICNAHTHRDPEDPGHGIRNPHLLVQNRASESGSI